MRRGTATASEVEMADDRKSGVCPDCGQKEDPRAHSWDTEDRPHVNPKECIRYLREQLERCVSALESHNLL